MEQIVNSRSKKQHPIPLDLRLRRQFDFLNWKSYEFRGWDHSVQQRLGRSARTSGEECMSRRCLNDFVLCGRERVTDCSEVAIMGSLPGQQTGSDSKERKDVKILLLGEPGVGKTSLIMSLVSEEFPDSVPGRIEEIVIPAEVTPEKIPTFIIDYCAAEQTEDQLRHEVQRADVICLVYSVTDPHSLLQLQHKWIPRIRDVLGEEHDTPLILVGNKSDMIIDTTMNEVVPLMHQFPEIETCVECSARTLKNISEMFFYAQKSVLHPTSPLYMIEEKDLTAKCKRALQRIFRICDADSDGLLNDTELNAFQRHCFHSPLHAKALEDVKMVVKNHLPDAIQKNSLTLEGFLFLHTLFIQRGRHETTWTVLRSFGYDNDLDLSPSYLHPQFKVPPGSSVELSPSGTRFLTLTFERFDRDKDGALSPPEVNDLLALCGEGNWENGLNRTSRDRRTSTPADKGDGAALAAGGRKQKPRPFPCPWGDGQAARLIVPTNEKGWISLQGFLCFFQMESFLRPANTLEILARLGYPFTESVSSVQEALSVTPSKMGRSVKTNHRGVFLCHVIGPKGSGKSTLCQRFLQPKGSSDVPLGPPPRPPSNVCSSIQVYGTEKYLIVHEIDSASDLLLPADIQCDVAALVYDKADPDSFQYAAKMFIKYFCDSGIPCLLVGTKSELQSVRQLYSLQPDQFATKYRLAPPQSFTAVSSNSSDDLYKKLATMATYPNLREFPFSHMHSMTDWAKLTFGAASVTLLGFLLFRYLQTSGGLSAVSRRRLD
ncbi:unnamed protein product [Cyprideis torosa]|uniref:Uncharacterized protein n=1 Tax=Cyprideis torosa TaxID=163714 RepID=A0A7R8W834_9CRUS|nr:unnamed protein product [Cyprideis torosa]CAG0883032.1 unnamed protein product [Cyprideis torosa]